MAKKQAFRQKPGLLLLAIAAAALGTISYGFLKGYSDKEKEKKGQSTHEEKKRKFTQESIALTLSHSILSSQLPLEEILLNAKNVTFILPPNLSLEDLGSSVNSEDEVRGSEISKTLLNNYKLLKCSNIQGYFNILKNLRPEVLYVCTDDLGIDRSIPPDLQRFIKKIVTVDQNKDDIVRKLSSVFIA